MLHEADARQRVVGEIASIQGLAQAVRSGVGVVRTRAFLGRVAGGGGGGVSPE